MTSVWTSGSAHAYRRHQLGIELGKWVGWGRFVRGSESRSGGGAVDMVVIEERLPPVQHGIRMDDRQVVVLRNCTCALRRLGRRIIRCWSLGRPCLFSVEGHSYHCHYHCGGVGILHQHQHQHRSCQKAYPSPMVHENAQSTSSSWNEAVPSSQMNAS